MKWITVPPFNDGDIRVWRVFALIPRDCLDGTTRWLELVYVKEVFREGMWGDMLRFHWMEIEAAPYKLAMAGFLTEPKS